MTKTQNEFAPLSLVPAGDTVHNVAGLRQLHPEPHHLHGLQHGLQGRLQEDHDLQYFSPDQIDGAAILRSRRRKASVVVGLLSKAVVSVANKLVNKTWQVSLKCGSY